MYTVRHFDHCPVCDKQFTRRGMTNHIAKAHPQTVTLPEAAHLEANAWNRVGDGRLADSINARRKAARLGAANSPS